MPKKDFWGPPQSVSAAIEYLFWIITRKPQLEKWDSNQVIEWFESPREDLFRAEFCGLECQKRFVN